ncbi:MAG: NAD(P)-dependent oxidoreductase [Hyphomicrobium sp.]
MARILVTGGTGLLGRNIVANLQALGHTPRVVTRQRRESGGMADVEHTSVDLLTADAQTLAGLTRGCDVAIHLAWETRHGALWSAPENLDWVGASLRLLRSFHDSGGQRFLGVGTGVEYEAPGDGPCIPGHTPIAPTHLYAVAKDAFHRVLASFAAGSEMEYAWARVFYLIGPGEAEERLVPSLISGLLAGRTVQCSSGRQLRDYMDVRDAGEAIARLGVTTAANGAFNIATGRPVTIADVARTVGRMLGKDELIALGAMADRPSEPPNLWGDITSLRQATGFEPRRSLDDAVEYSIAHAKEQRKRRNSFSATKSNGD